MPSLEERVAAVEARVEEQAIRMNDFRGSFSELRTDMARGFALQSLRFDALERRFEAIDRRFEAVDRRFEAVDRRFENMDRRFDGMELRFDAMERRFGWMVGIMVTGFITVIASIAGAFWAS